MYKQKTDSKILWLSALEVHPMDSIQKGNGQCILENAFLLRERTSPIVNKLAEGYVLQLKAMAI